MRLDLDTVRHIRPWVEARSRRTPMRRSAPAERRLGGAVWFKLECQQVTGSFKVRGPLALWGLRDDSRPWVTASAGNHGLGVAYALRDAPQRPLVFVPRTSPRVKRAAIEALDAVVRVVPTSSFDVAEAEAQRYSEQTGARFVSAFDDEIIMAGNGGTLGLEILEQIPGIASLLFPVGGGGLAAGVGCVLRALRPQTRLVGVQTEATSAMHESLQAGRAITKHGGAPTLAEGLEGGVSERSYEYARRWLDDVLVVPETSVAESMRWLWREHAIRVEGSAAVGIAACLGGTLQLPSPICIVLTGCNVDDETWERVQGTGAAAE